jgi:hypothetical protein
MNETRVDQAFRLLAGSGGGRRALRSRTGKGECHGPAGPAVDGAGRVYVADRGNHRVQVFKASERSWPA